MTRLLLAAALGLTLAGCGLPVAVVAGLVGAGLGYAASVNNLGVEILSRQDTAKPPASAPDASPAK